MTLGTTDHSAQTAGRISTAGTRLLISANPRAGSKSSALRVAPVKRALEAAGWHVRVTTQLAELSELATAWHAAGELRAVMAAGGDGTASAVCNAIPRAVPLLPLPLGTECLLARYIGQSAAPEAVVATVARGFNVPLDVGRAGDRLFLLMVSVGLDAEVVHRLQSRRTGHITHAAYVKPTLETLRSYKYPELHVHCQDEAAPSDPVACRWMLGFNLPCYARGLKFTPQADSCDGLLDVCTFGRGSWWNAARFLWHVSRGRHARLRDIAFMRGKKFRIEAACGTRVAVQVDGDRAGTLPMDVEVISRRLMLLVPPYGAERLGFTLPHE